MRNESRWRDGRPVALLFAATVVLPALVLAVLAYRALDSDRQLAERVWRERLEDAARRAYVILARHVLEIRSRAEDLARGESPVEGTRDGMIRVLISPELRVSPASAFAWLPGGRLPAATPLPPDLEQAETQELRAGSAQQSVLVYGELLQRAPSLWRGWIYLRLARALQRAGESGRSRAALAQAAVAVDAPGPVPTRLAARFELCSTWQKAEAASLYRDLSGGTWLLEKAPYSYYELQLREWAADRIPRETGITELHRQAMSQLLERVLNGEAGWLQEGSAAVLVTTASHSRQAAILTPEKEWKKWMAEASQETPQDLVVRIGSPGPANPRWSSAISLASLGLPWSAWSEPRDAGALGRLNEGRRLLLLAILLLVGGVLTFGSFATVRLVRRELRIAQLQSDFAATVSHEFRSPLTGIRQLGEMLLAGRAAHDAPRRRQYYELICRESDRLTRLVENILDFSRIEHGHKQYHFEKIDTGDWLRGLAGIAEQRRPIETSLPPGLPAVQGDREALSSAVLNLLDNAIKYSPADAPVVLRASGGEGWVTIEVRDQGCGIAPEEQRRIFDRFYRSANTYGGPAKGVGLGLALVKRIADAHGARLHVESTPGHGSTFHLSLKAAA